MKKLLHILLSCLIVLPLGAAERRGIGHNHIPDAVKRLTPIGDLSQTNRIPVGIVLPLRNHAAMEAMLKDLYDPASPNYQHWLTSTQFTEMFGPTETDYDSAIKWAETNGFSVVGRSKNRHVISLNADPATIRKGFGVRMKKYRHPREARDFYAPDKEPTDDCPVVISQVLGLDNYELPKPMIVPNSGITPAAGSGPSGSYIGTDFRKAYIPTTTQTGSGQSIALLQFDSYYPIDITNYCATAGISPVPDVVIVPVLGGTCPGCSGGSGNLEVSLDIEMAISMSPGIDHIYVYTTALNTALWYYLLNQAASDNLAKQISTSWGSGESYGPNVTGPLAQMQLQGQTYFNASGDYGGIAQGYGLLYPCQYTNVVSVGGTKLSTTSLGAYISESAWSGSTGGSSLTVPIPYWQTCAINANNYGSCSFRNNPDVAMIAYGVYVAYGNGVSTPSVGGTSVASPLWAAFMALVNQNRAANSKSSFGFLNPTLYSIGKGASYSANFNDIISGNTGSSTQYPATTKYDLATGWGSPKSALIATLLNSSVPTACVCATLSNPAIVVSNSFAITAENCAPTNNAVDPAETVTVSLGLKNIGAGPTVALVATMLTNGGITPITVSQSYGVLATNGTPKVASFSFTANGNCGDIDYAVLDLQDGTNDLGTVQFSFLLGKVSAATALINENFDSVTPPALPANWTSTNIMGTAWVTSAAASDSAPNSVFAIDPGSLELNDLDSPVFTPAAGLSQLYFRHSYFMEDGPGPVAYDGGVLEIKVGTDDWLDILTAGGSFVSGGYIAPINTHYSNPIAGRQAWTGNSQGWITTLINLPPSVAGNASQLRWRVGTDYGIGKPGWYIDNVRLTNYTYTCCP